MFTSHTQINMTFCRPTSINFFRSPLRTIITVEIVHNSRYNEIIQNDSMMTYNIEDNARMNHSENQTPLINMHSIPIDMLCMLINRVRLSEWNEYNSNTIQLCVSDCVNGYSVHISGSFYSCKTIQSDNTYIHKSSIQKVKAGIKVLRQIQTICILEKFFIKGFS